MACIMNLREKVCGKPPEDKSAMVQGWAIEKSRLRGI